MFLASLLFITKSRMPVRVLNLPKLLRKMKIDVPHTRHETYLTAKPRGSRASSAEPDSPPTVLNRTRRQKTSETRANAVVS